MADSSKAKNFEFNLIGNIPGTAWNGYNSANDKTAVAENIYVQGSLNVYKKLNGNIATRPGQKRLGAANAVHSAVASEFVWNTSWGATFTLAISDNTLWVIADHIWYPLKTGLTATRYVFDKWWDDANKKDVALFVHGNSDMEKWDGGFALIASTTINTITLDRTVLASLLPASGTVIINGTTYTYTGSAGSTLTGVTGDPTGEANGSGVLQPVVTTPNTPSAGFNNDFIKVINNQVYVGSYTSRLCYISANDDYTNYVVPTPRAAGDPELLTLDSTLNGIGVKNGNAWISIGTGEWAEVQFNDVTVGATLTQQTLVDVKPVAKLAGALAHEFIANDGNNLIYLAKDQQLRTVGDFNNSFVNAYPSLSQEISTELSRENFTNGSLKCIGDFTYITAPTTGKTYLYQVRQSVDANNQVVVERLWHAPFVWNATRIDEIDGVVVAFSNANPQIYQVWDTDQFHDDSPSDEPLPYTCVFALSYNTLRTEAGYRRQGLQSFDKVFSEGYITRGSLLNLTINYNYQGATNQITVPINRYDRPAYLFTTAVGSLGDSSLGEKPLGDEIADQTIDQDVPKFKVINSLGLINCFEYQLIFISDTVDSQWEILCAGTNATIEKEQDAAFIINKQRTTIVTEAGSFILQQDGFYIFQQDDSKIKL